MGIKVTHTVLRDAYQRLLATRMRTEAMPSVKRDAQPPKQGGRFLGIGVAG